MCPHGTQNAYARARTRTHTPTIDTQHPYIHTHFFITGRRLRRALSSAGTSCQSTLGRAPRLPLPPSNRSVAGGCACTPPRRPAHSPDRIQTHTPEHTHTPCPLTHFPYRPEAASSIVKCGYSLSVDIGPGHASLSLPLAVALPAVVPAHHHADPPIPRTVLFRPPYQPGMEISVLD